MTRRAHFVTAALCGTLAWTAVIGAQRSPPPITGATSVATTAMAITGLVVTAGEPSMPIGRALVTLSSPTLSPSRTLVTDDDGRFAFSNLPAGSFTLTVTKTPFAKTSYGAKRPGRAGTPIDLANGQRVDGIRIALSKGAAIVGTVRNSVGELVTGAAVVATPLDTARDPLRIAAITDDRGLYRIFGLPPGRYFVSVTASDPGPLEGTPAMSDEEMDRLLASLERRMSGVAVDIKPGPTTSVGAEPRTTGTPARTPTTSPTASASSTRRLVDAPIYYPSTPYADRAEKLTLGDGEERLGVDIDIRRVPTVTVSGHVTSPIGAMLPNTLVIMTRQDPSGAPVDTVVSLDTQRRPDDSGAFRYNGVTPGTYRLTARAAAPGGTSPQTPSDEMLWALADIAVGDADVTDVDLPLQPALHVAGRVVFDNHGLTPPADLSNVRLTLSDATGASTLLNTSSVRPDGSFSIGRLLPGSYHLTSSLAASGWWLRSLTMAGRELLDLPVTIAPTTNIDAAVLTFTDQHTELTGKLQTAASVAAPHYFMVVFSEDPAFWTRGSRRVRFTRPSSDGRFSIRDLPPGTYRLAALTDLDPDDLRDSAFIASLHVQALPVLITEGAQTRQDVQLAR